MGIDFKRLTKITLVLVYLVIVAGAVVRMTGSGMGCPDWPKCFGYLIPPTDEETLLWKPNHAYEKGQVIIINESLKIAKTDFNSSTKIDSNNWEAYTKHDYAVFNVSHTWTEYINRLIGAIAGLATLLLAIVALFHWKKNKTVTILSWLVVLGMGFQAWLGATVVYSVLEPVKITLHMLMALVIVAMLLYILALKSKKYPSTLQKQNQFLLLIALLFTLIQIVLGTQVRQFVDNQVDLVGYQAKSLWLNSPNVSFFVHRTFSLVVLALNVYLWNYFRKNKLPSFEINWVMLLLFIEIITGILMYYFDFPFASQPIHLVIASVLFGFQFYLVLKLSSFKNLLKTS